MRKIMIMAMLALGGVAMGPALAQGQPLAACAGQIIAIRHSEIKPGQLALFERAIAQHNAWYAQRKNATRTRLVRLVKRSGGTVGIDTDTAMTITFYDKAKGPPKSDAAHAAFVKLYSDSSTIKTEYRGCMGG